MSDTPPDRLSVDPDSPFHDAEVLQRDVGVRFKGEDKTNVEEYCVSEGWVRLALGNRVDRRGKPLTVKLQGVVTWFDNFCVLLRRDGQSQLVYKHAISTIMPGQPISLYEGED